MIATAFGPPGWEAELQRTLDFDRAFAALAGYEHPKASLRRGLIRLIQSEPIEALEHFAEAESRFVEGDSAESRAFLATLLAVKISALRVHPSIGDELGESVNGSIQVELDRLLAIDPAGVPAISRVQGKCRGFHFLACGEHADALKCFEDLVDLSRAEPQRAADSTIGAAAAAHELRRFKESRRHYENAELCMAFSNDRIAFSLFLAWLVALCSHWGWNGETSRWMETIRVLECPESTRQYLFAYAERLSVRVKAGSGLVLA